MRPCRHIISNTIGALVISAVAGPAWAQATTPRLSDKDVSNVMEQVDRGVGRFVDQMNPQLRATTFRGERGEIQVSGFLKDLQASIKVMRDRFKPPRYSSGAEVLAFLRLAKGLDSMIALRPVQADEARWHDTVPLFTRLADAYRIDWNADVSTWAAGRISDGELQAAVSALKKASEAYGKDLKNSVNKDKGLDAARKMAATDALTALSTAIKSLQELINRRADSTVAGGRVVAAAVDVRTFADGYAGAAALAAKWSPAASALNTIARAYGISR